MCPEKSTPSSSRSYVGLRFASSNQGGRVDTVVDRSLHVVFDSNLPPEDYNSILLISMLCFSLFELCVFEVNKM